jgi:hypothetical protein
MSDVSYQDGVEVLIDMLRKAFGDTFKEYYGGEPEELNDAELPCIMVTEQRGVIAAGATGTDDIGESLQIILALNKKDDIGVRDSNGLTLMRLRRLVKEQDPTTGNYKPNTVMYILRNHFTLDNIALSNTVETDFDVAQRGSDTYTQEAYITIRIQRMAIVPSRVS